MTIYLYCIPTRDQAADQANENPVNLRTRAHYAAHRPASFQNII